MKREHWSRTGFWILLGVVGGLLFRDLTSPPLLEAKGSASRYEEYCMVTGNSYDKEIDILWLLDYRSGRLHCILVNRAGRLGAIGELDLLEQFEIEEGSRAKPHFMMVTGAYQTGQTDLLYLAETVSGQVLCLAPPGTPGRGAQFNVGPRVIDRFRFRREGAIRPQ